MTSSIRILPRAHFHKGAHDQSNHFVEKTVAIELDGQTRTSLPDTQRINCADRAFFLFAAIRSEAGKIMSADEMFGRPLQNFEIDWACDVPGPTIFKWRQNRG